VLYTGSHLPALSCVHPSSPLDPASLVAEALHGNHVVCLVEHEDPDVLGIDHPLAEDVNDSTRRADYDLLVDPGASVPRTGNSEECFDIGVLADFVHDFLDLTSELSGRCKDNGLGSAMTGHCSPAGCEELDLLD
jgi:hypothetical protein